LRDRHFRTPASFFEIFVRSGHGWGDDLAVVPGREQHYTKYQLFLWLTAVQMPLLDGLRLLKGGQKVT
jgi:hypothetical protein